MAPLQDVRELLASIKTPGTFATRRTSAADDLRLEVKGVGRGASSHARVPIPEVD